MDKLTKDLFNEFLQREIVRTIEIKLTKKERLAIINNCIELAQSFSKSKEVTQ